MELNFVAVDVETANAARGSICQVGLVKVEGGRIADRWSSLVQPAEHLNHFDWYNTQLHGIGPADVDGAPTFPQAWAQMHLFLGGNIIAAHNASFDLGALRDAFEFNEVTPPSIDYACSLVIARRCLTQLSYGLPWVAEALQIPMTQHHDALADAVVTARVLIELARREQADSLTALLDAKHIRLGHIDADEWQGWRGSTYGGGGGHARPILPGVNPNADPDHLLYGKHVVFTGGLDSMTRQTAWEALADVGGIPEKGVNKRTDILVIGPDLFTGHVVRSEHMTGKMAKAAALLDKGHPIEVMSEQDFCRSL